MPASRLIVNADDYGRTAGISRGIRQAHLRGIVTSTTCMLNFPAAAEEVRLALAETPTLGLGVHLVLTAGRPVRPAAAVPSLVDAGGRFLSLDEFSARREALDAAEVLAEWRAQVEAFCAAAGRPPTHLDSHHHAAYYTPALLRALLALAREIGCAVRLPRGPGGGGRLTALPAWAAAGLQPHLGPLLAEFAPRAPDGFFDSFYGETATAGHLTSILAQARPGTHELMCHPGYSDAGLAAGSSYAAQREAELKVLTDPQVRAAVSTHGWELVSFSSLAD